MQSPVHIVYHGSQASHGIRARIMQRSERLRPATALLRCHVRVERWCQHQKKEPSFEVVLELARRAGADCGVRSEPQASLDDALDQAFSAVEAALQKALRKAASEEPHASEARRLHPLHSPTTEDWSHLHAAPMDEPS
jgi:hypothetical protein